MKKIFIIYSGDDWHLKQPLKNSPATRQALEDWQRRAVKNNIKIYRGSLQWYDLAARAFRRAWTFENQRWIKINQPVKPDLIYDKCIGARNYELYDLKIAIGQQTRIYNDPNFRLLADNKLTQYMLLAEFMPQSFLVKNRQDWPLILPRLKSRRVVVKPLFGSGGAGIKILNKAEAAKLRPAGQLLVQEFIDCYNGLPGQQQIKGVADLRLSYVNHVLMYALSRIAEPGSLFTNFHRGATAVLIPRRQIPSQVMAQAKKIVKRLSAFPQAQYSLDFMFDRQARPFLIEINSTPGLCLLELVDDERMKNRYYQAFADMAGG